MRITYADYNIPFQNSKLDLGKADTFVSRRGVEIWWDKAIICPCINDYNVPDSMCRSCFGRGLSYVDSTDTIVLFSNMEGIPNFMSPGMWVFGMANISTLSTIKLGKQDRLTLKHFDTSYMETVKATGISFNTLFNILSIDYVYYRDSNKNLVEITDYTYTDHTITLSTPLALLTQISIRYKSNLRYIVVSMLHEARGIKDHNGRTVVLPNQYLVQREDVVLETKKRSIQGIV